MSAQNGLNIVWISHVLPSIEKTVQVSLKDAYRIRRLAKITGKRHLRRLTVFVKGSFLRLWLSFRSYSIRYSMHPREIEFFSFL